MTECDDSLYMDFATKVIEYIKYALSGINHMARMTLKKTPAI